MPLTPESALRKDRAATSTGPLEHRHFAVIAGILRELAASPCQVEKWADKLARTNPRFDRRRFIRAASA